MEKPATPSPAEKILETEKDAQSANVANGQDAEVTRVNSRQSDRPASIRENPKDLEEVESSYYLSGKRLWLVHTGILLSVLLVALDQSIVATALPSIASQFKAVDQLTWIVSTYFLVQSGLLMFFGQLLTIVSSKWIFLVCIVIFEIGSLICGVAPSMNVLIFGRAIQGVGGSGGFVAVLTIISQMARLELRAVLLGSFGAVFGFASVIGPLLGGVFTDRLTWRWCFYINLPFGGVSLAAVTIFLPFHPPLMNEANEGKTVLQKWLHLDWMGAILSLGMTVALLLPLTWGGVTRPWNDRVVIALFVLSGVLFILLILWERRMGKHAMMPLDIFLRRTQLGAGFATFAIMLVGTLMTYYIPFFYQAKGKSAEQSGINIIPFMMSEVVGSGLAGWLSKVTGRYKPFLLIGPILYGVAGGLFFTVHEHTPNARIIGFQIILGFGAGLAFQQPLMAIQAEYAHTPDLIPQASSLLTYFQLLGAVVGISIAGSVFGNQLSKNLAIYSAIIPQEVITGVKQSVSVIFQLPAFLQGIVITAYIDAIRYAFIIVVPGGGITLIAALFVKGWNLKEREIPAGAVAV